MMLQTTEELRPYIYGAVRIETGEDGFLSFRRLTALQEEVLVRRGFSPRELATAGVKLDFYANGGEVRFDYHATRGAAVNHLEIDATVDGIELYHFENPEQIDVDGTVAFRVPERDGMSRVTVFFPNLAAMKIKNLVVPDGIRRAMRGTRILMAGDSITHGYYASHPRLSYPNIVGERLNADVLNQGIGGDKYHADNLDPELPFDPDIITVAYGTNDWAAAIPDLAAKIDAYYARLRTIYPNTPVLAIPPIWRGKTDGVTKNGLTLEDVRNLVRDTARRYGCYIADSSRLVPPHEDFFFDKTLHPNNLGFTFYGEAVADLVNEILHRD
ncbi:MAG: SGNH/GDSL hydrolase family protein [Eubacteriales bacterium]|nr:SGNH/GDSL hydrolase family protein [Eubacteriales bacterium]